MNDSERNDPDSSTRLDPAEAALLLIAGRISAPVEPEPVEAPEPEAGEGAAPPQMEPAEDAAGAAPAIEPVPADPVSADPLEAPLAGVAGVEQEPVEVAAHVPDPIEDPVPPAEPPPDLVESMDAEPMEAEPVEAELVDEPAEDWPPEPPIMAARPEPAIAPERIAAGNPPPPVPEIDGERLAVPPPAGMNRIIVAIAALSILFGLGAIMTSAWVYSEAQRDLRQLATDVAQLRVGLELFARQQTAAPDVGEVYARLMEVEQSVREALSSAPQGAGAGTAPALPSIGLGPSAQSDGDCLPPGTRFLVTTGDRYPVCGTQGVVEILSVGALDIALGDGSAVAIGGSTTLANTSCTVSVLSANEDGMSGYGEIRVNC